MTNCPSLKNAGFFDFIVVERPLHGKSPPWNVI